MDAGWSMLPAEWQNAFRRDAEEPPSIQDPRPERRLARLLAAYIATGLVFLVFPGTVLGVWNLIGISSQRQAEAVPAAWIQAHGHAQLLGWVGTFIIGISLYTFPKFRSVLLRSLPLGWVMLFMWTAGISLRWWAAVYESGWHIAFPLSAAFELLVSVLVVWQCSAPGRSRRRIEAWEILIFAGFAGLVVAMALQLALVLSPLPSPMIPIAEGRLLITWALWIFCFPTVLGYASRLFPGILFTPKPHRAGAVAMLGLLWPAGALYAAGRDTGAAILTFASVAVGCWAARVFHPASRRPKASGIDPLYPLFARLAFAWLFVSAALGIGASAPGVLGASRHAFTVGFLATLIFAVGPRILPSFLNSRELWSPRLMRASLVLLTLGCTLRVTSEPLAYRGAVAVAWRVLPGSAVIELTAVLLFAINIAKSAAAPVPAWFRRDQVNGGMSVFWLIHSYPGTRRLLIQNGLQTLARAREVPRSLTLSEAASADGADVQRLGSRLGEFFEARLPRSVRRQTDARSQ